MNSANFVAKMEGNDGTCVFVCCITLILGYLWVHVLNAGMTCQHRCH